MRSVGGVCYVTGEEMREIDRLTTSEFGVEVGTLMENAGTAVASLARMKLGGDVGGKEVCCLVGTGNNGGDGLVAGRILHNWGAKVSVVLSEGRGRLHEMPARQLGLLEGLEVEVEQWGGSVPEADLLLDALLGYGSVGNPRPPVSQIIEAASASERKILAVDIPSGLDATTGAAGEPCIKADYTLSLGLPKEGFLTKRGREVAGEIWVADISIPPELYRRFGMDRPPFGAGKVLRLTTKPTERF